jgi:Na+-translocating ferredoxin:NAD+ oxidoreductase RNF subunit RnfB
MNIIFITAIFAAVLAFVLGFALGFFKKFFMVEEDPLIGQLREVLPGANCGGCGYPGCDGYAAAIAAGEAPVDRCTVGGKTSLDKLSALMGVTASLVPVVALLTCRGTRECAAIKGKYTGLQTCRGAKISTGGTKLCAWGCMGFGDCTKVCQFGALSMGKDGLPVIDSAKCTGCKACATECPQNLIRMVTRGLQGPAMLCANRNTIRAMVRRTCTIGCMKCELCVRSCPQKCISMDKFLPLIDYSRCTNCGTCVSKCPAKVYRFLEPA